MNGWRHLTPADLAKLGRAPAKVPKFRNTKVLIDGQVFDSKKEGQRYLELSLLQRAGTIRDLETQITFLLFGANGEQVADYRADFRYVEVSSGRVIVEDVKGGDATKTRLYQLKKKLLRCQGIEITEV